MSVNRSIRANSKGEVETIFDETASADKVLIVDSVGTVVNIETGDVATFAKNNIDLTGANLQRVMANMYGATANNHNSARVSENQSLLASASRTTSTQTPTQTLRGANSITIYLNVTTQPGAQTIQIELWGENEEATAAIQIISVGSVNATGLWTVALGQNVANRTNGNYKERQAVIPFKGFVLLTHSGAGTWVYTLSLDINRFM